MMIHLASNDSQSELAPYSGDQVQPNAIDLRLDRVFKFSSDAKNEGYFLISEEEKHHYPKVELFPNSKGFFRIEAGSCYEITFEGIITMGPDEAGWVITRSTLNRNGLFITSGLYDSGYKGAMAGALHNNGGIAHIKKGTRVGQFLLFKSQTLKLYDGSYGIATDGTIKTEEKRYHQ